MDIGIHAIFFAEFTRSTLYLNIACGGCDDRPGALLVGSVHPRIAVQIFCRNAVPVIRFHGIAHELVAAGHMPQTRPDVKRLVAVGREKNGCCEKSRQRNFVSHAILRRFVGLLRWSYTCIYESTQIPQSAYPPIDFGLCTKRCHAASSARARI